jgi:16S rRNA G966 N2-methylase RsmD
VMSHLLPEYRDKVRLFYIDPPFTSKANYKKKIELRGKIASSDANAFEEKQYTKYLFSKFTNFYSFNYG